LAGSSILKTHKLKGDIMKEGHLINKINRLIPTAKAVPISEFFDDDGKGIWFRGSEYLHGEHLIFNGFTVHPELEEILEDAGWMWEPYDMGTLMAYPN